MTATYGVQHYAGRQIDLRTAATARTPLLQVFTTLSGPDRMVLRQLRAGGPVRSASGRAVAPQTARAKSSSLCTHRRLCIAAIQQRSNGLMRGLRAQVRWHPVCQSYSGHFSMRDSVAAPRCLFRLDL